MLENFAREAGVAAGNRVNEAANASPRERMPAIALRSDGAAIVREALTDHSDEVIDEWLARHEGVTALVQGPQQDSRGFLTIMVTLQTGGTELLRCAIPTLPAYKHLRRVVYELVFSDESDDGLRAELRRGFTEAAPSLALPPVPERNWLRVEHLGPRVEREDGWMYFVRGGTVCRQRPRSPGAAPSPREDVLEFETDLDFENWLYFVDAGGEVSRIPLYQVAMLETWMQASTDERAALLHP